VSQKIISSAYVFGGQIKLVKNGLVPKGENHLAR